MPARRAKLTGTPTPSPAPMALSLLPGCILEEGILTIAADEGEPLDGVDGIEDDIKEELVEGAELVVEVVLGWAYPRVVCILAGPKENTRDGVEQQPASLKSYQQ